MLEVLHYQILGAMINSDDSIKIFKEEANLISTHYPTLSCKQVNGHSTVYGYLELTDANNKIVDSYEVEIHYSNGYPFRFPLVFEIGGRIPINIDWHVFETDGHCCIATITEEILKSHKGITLAAFIENQVKPYFFNQTFRNVNGYFLKERSHGIKGSIEFFEEMFKTNNLKTILQFLKFISKKVELKSTAKCLCGSNKKYKKCHRRSVQYLLPLSNEYINFIINLIETY